GPRTADGPVGNWPGTAHLGLGDCAAAGQSSGYGDRGNRGLEGYPGRPRVPDVGRERVMVITRLRNEPAEYTAARERLRKTWTLPLPRQPTCLPSGPMPALGAGTGSGC